jgi:hypothetical protein
MFVPYEEVLLVCREQSVKKEEAFFTWNGFDSNN